MFGDTGTISADKPITIIVIDCRLYARWCVLSQNSKAKETEVKKEKKN